MFEKESPDNTYTLTLTMRQLSLTIATLLAFCFFIFIAGYFLGQKRAAEEFSYRADQDSLADQIYSSMCVLYDTKDDNEENVEAENNEDSESSDLSDASDASEEKETQEALVTQPEQNSYKLTIAGFSAGNSAAGKKMVARLINKGYAAELVEIASKTAKGKTIVWYQVIAKVSVKKDDLSKTRLDVSKIAQVKEKNISINECA